MKFRRSQKSKAMTFGEYVELLVFVAAVIQILALVFGASVLPDVTDTLR